MAEPGKPKPVALTPEQKQQAIDWVEEHAQARCPMCQSRNWEIADEIVQIVPLYRQFHFGGGPVYPQVMFMCKNCGYGMMFNAIRAGIVPEESPPNAK